MGPAIQRTSAEAQNEVTWWKFLLEIIEDREMKLNRGGKVTNVKVGRGNRRIQEHHQKVKMKLGSGNK